MSSKLFQILCTFIVIMLVAAGMYKTVLDQTTESTQDATFDNMKTAVQKGLVQMHWQWQYEGRPDSIDYEAALQEQHRIAMNDAGWPQVVGSVQGCKDILAMFVDDGKVQISALETNIDLERLLALEIAFKKANDSQTHADICRYQRKGQEFEYHLGTGIVR
ncbi:hypothetical protein ISG33_09835 [Glaciecola sp. MH2013]|uniref:hypothetical protein n=1 Tax=Glaciecola sp. MH2013 TaxID=2785524 RepID=UPI00189DCED3|nr:hypothetical protein [Glaciecola sp. MH2013]MBF7073695.1 hypothetical protein [Glaciecola sp. MH2013]